MGGPLDLSSSVPVVGLPLSKCTNSWWGSFPVLLLYIPRNTFLFWVGTSVWFGVLVQWMWRSRLLEEASVGRSAVDGKCWWDHPPQQVMSGGFIVLTFSLSLAVTHPVNCQQQPDIPTGITGMCFGTRPLGRVGSGCLLLPTKSCSFVWESDVTSSLLLGTSPRLWRVSFYL